ncbi:hypothetical protein [Streptomyces sp. SDr-06]|uniref:hypothetical protein n=2 Tax=unclassified Streptomyces TaxID=2593676 RepID=UPI001675D79A|nr:hypothetical protein [Streptomyces sp. SDr-06]
MHANEHSRTNDTRRQPGLAPARAQAPAHPMPVGLPSLQAGAGNAAVVQMLRQAGHRWTPERAGEARTDSAQIRQVQRKRAAVLQRVPQEESAERMAAPAAAGPVEALAPSGQAETELPNEPQYLLQIQVSKTSRTHRTEFSGGGFGHAWVALYKKEPGRKAHCTTYGFFPAQRINAAGALKTVRGEVRTNYDQPSEATAKLDPVGLTEGQAQKVREYARANRDYNLATYNCTSFARGLYKAATGLDAPGLRLPLLENPNLLQDAIKQFNEERKVARKGPHIKVADDSDSETESEPDEVWENHRKAPVLAVAAPAAAAAPQGPRFELE